MSSHKHSLSLMLLTGQLVALAAAGSPYCLPGNPCYPSDANWSEFNATVGGRLIKTTPYGAPCYAATYNAAECLFLAQNKGKHAFRDSLPAVLMYTNWEQTADLRGCPVPDLPTDGSAPPPVNAVCTLGGMSNYVVNATGVDDIAASVKWAAKFNLRFRIKNTGHCYAGRSSGEGSFSVWTGHLNDAQLGNDFVPKATKLAPQTVISAGPAVNVEGLFKFGSENGVVTIGGFTQTVGASGGYILGGGTGPLGPKFGLGVDNVVQFEVVMADGSQQTVNEALNPDLFWALRGGGGTFAVVTRAYIKTYPAFKTVNTVSGQVVCQNASSYSEMISVMVDLQVAARGANQTGIWETDPATHSLALVSFATFTGDAETVDKSLAVYHPITTVSGCQPKLATGQFNGSGSWFAAYNNILPLIDAGGIVGLNLASLSRLISNDLINDPAGREKIKQFIITSPVPTIIQNAVGGATNEVPADATAVNPGWRNVFSFMDSPVAGPWQGITAQQNATLEAVSASMTATFGTAVYYNEQHPANVDWQDSQWGSNYPRLLSIKRKVDPNGVFSCRNCVGSEAGF
ncbi:hypothetical protein TOPH_06479 [Tolypocladium ophioglossoides CBS 100239]|uniref:FAD-binding PCMH-type domain-containing protein n=1 Tax=Tolypocladium ophioglossoides (strain CBS 100239) TaxID=1163406 RepID=A0A0L0N4E2_TOLOC|nr:hypothetical protein TOPH_06479 [Tolypocladium ophioglossoides CBS 100239]